MQKRMVRVLGRADLIEESIAGHAQRSPYDVDFLHLGTPLTECLCAACGPVSQEFIANLEIPGYDQAPVEASGNATGWRLVRRTKLEELRSSADPLGDHPSHFESDDAAEVGGTYISLHVLLGVFLGRRAAIVFAREEHATDMLDESGTELALTELKVLGLLTISDLNRREVRKSAYALLLELETLLGDLVDRRFEDSWEWVRHLRESAQVNVIGNWELSRKRGIDTKMLEYANLLDLLTVVSKTPALRHAIGIPSKELEDAVGKINKLRNRVMHPVRPFVLGEKDVRGMLDAVGAALELQARLRGIVEP